MTTRADLDDAFALLERSADDYAAQYSDNAGDHHPVDVPLLVLTPTDLSRRRTRSRRHHVLAGLVAAAAVAGLAVAAVGTGTPDGPSDVPSLAGGATMPLTTLPFTVRPGTGLTVIDAQTGGDTTTAELVGRNSHFQVGFSAADPRTRVTPGSESVDVDGHQGYFVADGPPFVEPGDRTAEPKATYAQAVIWTYAPDSWALLTAQGMTHEPGRAALLTAARALDVDTPSPMRIGFTVSRAPVGHTLDMVFSAPYQLEGEQLPRDLTPLRSQSEAHFTAADGRSTIEIVVTTKDTDSRSGKRITFGGRAAWFDAAQHRLSVLRPDDSIVSVLEVDDGSHPGAATMGLPELESVLATVTVVDHPVDRRSWVDAGDLP